MKPYLLSPKAEQDIEAIWDYTEANWGMSQAEVYLNSIRTALSGLCDKTFLSQSAEHIRQGYRRAIVGSHNIFFKDDKDAIIVIRILHQRMHTGRLLDD